MRHSPTGAERRFSNHVRLSDVARIFVDYARSHPDKMGLRAAAVAYNAMAKPIALNTIWIG